MKLLEFQEKAGVHDLKVFTTTEFQRMMNLKRKAAQELLSRYAGKGVVTKLRNKYYAMVSNPPSTCLISNKIYQPSYISFETALSHHGILPETVYELTAATTKPTREFRIQERIFSYHKIKDAAYTGYGPMRLDGDTILMADPEKALIDHLYFVHLGKKPLNERINLSNVNKKRTLKYSQIYHRKKFTEFVESVIR